MIRPTPRLILGLGFPLALAVAEVFAAEFGIVLLAVGALLLLAAAVDWLRTPRPAGLSVIREIATTMPVGIARTVHLRVLNKQARAIRFRLWDLFPGQLRASGLPSPRLSAAPGHALQFAYKLHPDHRGTYEFGRTQLALVSPWGFWERLVKIGEASSIRVYPDYVQVLKSALLAARQRLDMMGILKRRRRGEGTEFQQLREFRVGDRLNQVNWKATAKLATLISNEFQEERDQQIVFLLDGSYRMRSQDGALSHFDHTLNAIILLTYFAVKQGDAIGLLTFGGSHDRYVAPAKGKRVIPELLDTLFDLQPSNDSPDYQMMSRQLLRLVKKRSLIVLVTTLRDDVAAELKSAIRAMTARHLVLVANIHEAILGEIAARPIHSTDDALTWLGAQDFVERTRRAVDGLRGGGVDILDSSARDLPIAISNRYLALKQSGRI
jgi:uncharacterized protein (DUF58 family)